jgi:hypothetical protein
MVPQSTVGMVTARPASNEEACMTENPNPEEVVRVGEAIAAGHKIQAIKMYRAAVLAVLVVVPAILILV